MGLLGRVPPGFVRRSADKEGEAAVLFVVGQRGAVRLRKALVHGAVLEELQGSGLPVQVVGHHLQTVQEHRLPHHVQVLAQRVHNVDATLCREGFQLGIIVLLGEGVVHGLHKAVGGQPVGDGVTRGFGIRLLGGVHAHPKVLGQLDVVVPVDAEDFFHHVALAGHVHHVGRGRHQGTIGLLLQELVIQAFQDLFNGFMADFLADEMLDALVVQLNLRPANLLGIYLTDLAHNLSAGHLLDKEGGAFGGVQGGLGVCPALEAEAGVRGKLLALGRAADAHGVEVSSLDEHVHGAVRDAGILSAEHARDAHGAIGVGNNHVTGMQAALDAVQGTDFLPFGGAAHNHLGHHLGGVEGVQRLAGLEEHEVGNVHHVVDGLEADGHQPLLQPFRAGGHLHALHRDAGVAGRALAVQHLHGDGLPFPFAESLHGREAERCRNVLAAEVAVEVTGHAYVGSRINAVGGNLIFNHGLVLELEVLLGGSAHHGALREHHDALMAGANAKFVLGTDHSKALHAPDLGFLNLEVSGKDGAYLGKKYFLAGGYVGRAAYHLDGLGAAVIHRGNVQVVAVRMRLAGKDLGHHNALEAAGNHFLHLYAVHLDADGSHGLRHLVRGEVTLQILF